jgi:predicted SAM-dependent methyltransferase
MYNVEMNPSSNGSLDKLTNNYCRGWATLSNGDRATISVSIAGKHFGNFTASEYREDLCLLNISDGYSGFFIKLPRNTDAGDIEVNVVESQITLSFDESSVTNELAQWKKRKVQRLLGPVGPDSIKVLEFGALHNPLNLPKNCHVAYVDHASTRKLVKKYSNDKHVDTREFVQVDYVWPGGKMPKSLLKDGLADIAIASHVIEHVPDPISWLQSVRHALKPGGVLALSIPDKRYTFDYLRENSSLTDLVGAFLEKPIKPTARMIFDAKAHAVTRNGKISWYTWDKEVQLNEIKPVETIESAYNFAKESASTSDYVDVHCWVFTNDSFLDLMSELIALDLIPFDILEISEPDGNEFIARLRAL